MIGKLVLGITAAAVGLSVCGQQSARPRQNNGFNTPREAVNYYENLVGRLSSQVSSMQDENAMLTASNAELKQRVSRLESEVRSLADDIAAMRKQIAADAEVRKNQLNNLADKIAESARKPKPVAQPVPAPVQNPAPVKAAKPEPKDSVEYVEHQVEKGTTLNALAKAYKVSVNDIIKANKLKNTNIYVGQKLLIPVPPKR